MPTYPAPFFVIAGPTAVGKSEIAVMVAELCGGEIISADAFQIYRGLEILSAQPALEMRNRIPHHLVGEIPLAQTFDVGQFLRLAQARIKEIHLRGRLPIMVGGTGLYLRALTHGLADLPGGDAALRAQLENRTASELDRQLAELDPLTHAHIDRKNRRRVIRALEVCLLTGRPFSSFREQWEKPSAPCDGVVLTRARPELQQRIEQRTAAMFDAGVVEEVRSAPLLGPTASQTLGWKEIRALLDEKMTREDCRAAITVATRRYAKRQMTWFRREKHLEPQLIHGETDLHLLAAMLAARARRNAEN